MAESPEVPEEARESEATPAQLPAGESESAHKVDETSGTRKRTTAELAAELAALEQAVAAHMKVLREFGR
ncbi:hypothetical protein [Streptomyces sp. NPDC049881]|uniref:hypothetical protein n=1 Tax=Streptomyces sp. NPDC049881 TaxID=3155778 RepID=UPI003448EBCB